MAGPTVPEAIVYPGAPLRAVAVEVGFRSLLDATARFGAFQRRHFHEYNRLVESSGDERESAQRPEGREFMRPGSATLVARDRGRAVSVAKDQLAAITYDYGAGFTEFMTWALPTLREGLEDLGVERVLDVRYRYENRIEHDTSNADLGSLFKLSLAAPSEAGTTTRHVHLYWQQKWADGTVSVDLDACPNVSRNLIHLNITSQCRAKSGSLDEMDGIVRTAHRLARRTFDELITSQFRDRLLSRAAS